MRQLLGKIGLVAVAVVTAVAGYQATARADDSMRCENKLVKTGAAPYEVRATCGNPDDIQARTEMRTVRRAVTVPCATGYCSSFVEDSVPVNVEEWTYDFGPQRFIQYLTFVEGRLFKIRSGRYGVKQL